MGIIRHDQTYLVADYTYCKVAVRRDHIAACSSEIAYIAGTIIAISACCWQGSLCDNIGWVAVIQRDTLGDVSHQCVVYANNCHFYASSRSIWTSSHSVAVGVARIRLGQDEISAVASDFQEHLKAVEKSCLSPDEILEAVQEANPGIL